MPHLELAKHVGGVSQRFVVEIEQRQFRAVCSIHVLEEILHFARRPAAQVEDTRLPLVAATRAVSWTSSFVNCLMRFRCASAGGWEMNQAFNDLANMEPPSNGSRMIMFTIS